jgi:hypothetical protein
MLNYTDTTPKHLYPKLNGYGDNGKRSLKVWQLLHTYVTTTPPPTPVPQARWSHYHQQVPTCLVCRYRAQIHTPITGFIKNHLEAETVCFEHLPEHSNLYVCIQDVPRVKVTTSGECSLC